jgi:glutamyl-Q tRNA(Asp) synthetase
MITRFAPSPTGHLHIGHAWSAMFSSILAKTHNGEFILRIEDIDLGRCRPEFTTAIYDDLEWLGLNWPKPVRRQSEHFTDYIDALHILKAHDLLYPCFCTRKDIHDEIERSTSAPHGPEGPLYPGTCRNMSEREQEERIAAGMPYALRLNVAKAIKLAPDLTWTDLYRGEQKATPEILGDVVLGRKGIAASYHLCVTVDDHLQGITLVTRGEDLFYASHLHRLLQHLLNYKPPQWAHHPLLLDAEGKRFAKRNDAVTLQSLREHQGKTRLDIIQMVRENLPDTGPWQRLLMHL